MIRSKVSKLFFILGILVFFLQGLGLANMTGTPAAKKGTIVKDGHALNFEKSDRHLVVRDRTGETLFRWKAKDGNTSLKDFSYSSKCKDFVVLLELSDPEKKLYSLVCRGPGFEEKVKTGNRSPFGGAVYFEIQNETEERDQWVVFLTNNDILSYYHFAKKRLMAKEKYPTPVLGIEKSVMDGNEYLILNQAGKGNTVRQFKKEFSGPKPARNPLLPME